MIGTDLEQAKYLLQAGHLVAIPTETVYGLAGNGLDATAVSDIFKVKQRPSFDPLIYHVSDLDRVMEVAADFPEKARQLAAACWPGPLTLVLRKQPHIPDLATSGLNTVGVRVPAHPITQLLLAQLDFPLAAPSANPFGYISPTTAQHVENQLGSQIPYILDGGPCQVGIESTIVGFTPDGQPIVYRKGGIAIETIEKLIGKVQVMAASSSQPQAPGMLDRHYAPRVPLVLGNIDDLLRKHGTKKMGVIAFSKLPDLPENTVPFILSATQDFGEAARKLFGILRELDERKPDIILAELLPERDLGRAINDRLRRAAAGSHSDEV